MCMEGAGRIKFENGERENLEKGVVLIKWGVRNPLSTRYFRNLSLNMSGSKRQEYCCGLNSAVFFSFLFQIYVKFDVAVYVFFLKNWQIGSNSHAMPLYCKNLCSLL